MKKMFAALVVLLAVSGVRAGADDFPKQLKTVPISALYQYDKNMPYEIEKKVLRESPTTISYTITFTSRNDLRVPALLTLPKGKGPYPLVLFVHGYGMKRDLGPMADTMIGSKGYALFAIDLMYKNDREREGRDLLSQYVYTSRNAMIQTIVDYMRGLDMLLDTEPKIDKDRIGVMGLSMGTILGSMLFSMDDRIKVAGFGVGGGDFVHSTSKSIFGPAKTMKKAGLTMDAMEAAMIPVEPTNFAFMSKGRPVFMANGRLDELIPPEAAHALYQAFGEPKHIVWFDGGHVPSVDKIMTLVGDMFDWYNKYLKPKNIHPIEKDKNHAPTMTKFWVKDDGNIHQDAKVDVFVAASDPDGDLTMVKATFLCSDQEELLKDNGNGADEKAGDGVYSARVTLFERATLGKCPLSAVAVDTWGETSKTFTASIADVKSIIYPPDAHPPVVVELSVPKQAAIGENAVFSARVTDPDNNIDQIIASIVELGLTLSLPSAPNGVFEMKFPVPDFLEPGEYHVTVQAKDKTKMYSEKKTALMKVLPAVGSGKAPDAVDFQNQIMK